MLNLMQRFICEQHLIGLGERAAATSFQVPFIRNQPGAHPPDKQAPYRSHIHMQQEDCSSVLKVLCSGMMSDVSTLNKHV